MQAHSQKFVRFKVHQSINQLIIGSRQSLIENK